MNKKIGASFVYNQYVQIHYQTCLRFYSICSTNQETKYYQNYCSPPNKPFFLRRKGKSKLEPNILPVFPETEKIDTLCLIERTHKHPHTTNKAGALYGETRKAETISKSIAFALFPINCPIGLIRKRLEIYNYSLPPPFFAPIRRQPGGGALGDICMCVKVLYAFHQHSISLYLLAFFCVCFSIWYASRKINGHSKWHRPCSGKKSTMTRKNTPIHTRDRAIKRGLALGRSSPIQNIS